MQNDEAVIGRRIGRRVCAGVVALGAVLFGVILPVAAQINDSSVQPENIELLKSEAPVLHYALAGGFLLAALAVGFKPSKRAVEQKK